MTELARENVQSYPRPPALQPVPQRIRVRLGGALAADTTRAVRVLETHHAPSYYLPPEDIHATLRPVPGSSFCEWKSVARCFVHLRTTGTLRLWHYYQAAFDVTENWGTVSLPLTAFKASGSWTQTLPDAKSLISVALAAYGRDHDARIDLRDLGFY